METETEHDTASETASETERREQVYEALHNVYDPELGVNVVDLGLIYGVEFAEGGRALITMTLTTPGCPMHDTLGEAVGLALETVPGVTGGEIRIVWTPPWDPSMMTEAGRAELGFWD